VLLGFACGAKGTADPVGPPVTPDSALPPARIVVDSGPVGTPTDGDSPGTLNPGGTAGSTRADARQPDAGPDVAPPDVPSAGFVCDLLLQNCPGGNQYGCYPLNGTGRCRFAGAGPQYSKCTPGEDQPSCERGTFCEPATYVCRRLCDTTAPPGSSDDFCAGFSTCVRLAGHDPVGYCEPH
jgi:hypothetical protein